MRFIALALVLAAPACAVASSPATIPTPEYRQALSSLHRQPNPEVRVTFVNQSVTDRELVIDGQQYKLRFRSTVSVMIPVGDPVFIYSEQNSKVNGQELMRATVSDAFRTVLLR